MKMNTFDIRQWIGEATEYDKKQALEINRPKSWCKSVSAFANGVISALELGHNNPDIFAHFVADRVIMTQSDILRLFKETF